MPDPAAAHLRRGAAFTFNAPAYLALVKQLRAPLGPDSKTIYAPSFDHAVKDPVENDIPVEPNVKVCLFEGNYVALNKEGWAEAASLMDEIWFVDVDEKLARQRLVKRHVKAGIVKDEAEARKRADEIDMANGLDIIQHRVGTYCLNSYPLFLDVALSMRDADPEFYQITSTSGSQAGTMSHGDPKLKRRVNQTSVSWKSMTP